MNKINLQQFPKLRNSTANTTGKEGAVFEIVVVVLINGISYDAGAGQEVKLLPEQGAESVQKKAH